MIERGLFVCSVWKGTIPLLLSTEACTVGQIQTDQIQQRKYNYYIWITQTVIYLLCLLCSDIIQKTTVPIQKTKMRHICSIKKKKKKLLIDYFVEEVEWWQIINQIIWSMG